MIATHQFHPEDKRLQESLTAIGNGYMGMRGNFEEQYSGISFQELISVVFGFRIKPALVGGKWLSCVLWQSNQCTQLLPIRIKVNEQPVDLAKNSFRDFYLALDLHQDY